MSDERPEAGSALAWLAARPDFELRSPDDQARTTLPLARPAALIDALGRPDRRYRIALVAGTKGKGSTAVLLAALLRAHGLRVGLYTQPHLHRLTERIRVEGGEIEPAQLEALLTRLRPHVERCDAAQPRLGPLTSYEITTCAALDWFAERRVDWAVVEVGLGGRLDATNVTDPAISIITPISYDHTHLLGRTLGAIATEKAGIIRPAGLVVSGPQRPAALAAIRATARRQQADLTVIGEDPLAPRLVQFQARRLQAGDPIDAPFFRFSAISAHGKYGDLSLHLGGAHQLDNALTALAALEAAADSLPAIDSAAVARGLAAARWPGRLEVAGTTPLLVLDGAHNGDSAERLRQALQLHFAYDRLHLVVGVFIDKDLRAILRPFRVGSQVYATEVDHPRARPSEQIAVTARRLGCSAVAVTPVATALGAARKGAGPGDLICVTGSLAVVAAGRQALGLWP